MFTADDDVPNERFILDDANANVGEATRFIEWLLKAAVLVEFATVCDNDNAAKILKAQFIHIDTINILYLYDIYIQ